ncbi:MAG TPA: response regulator [Candidatus Olsenella avistercoris]|nr:response regulator [Candidatus Olsenella avistercoris]
MSGEKNREAAARAAGSASPARPVRAIRLGALGLLALCAVVFAAVTFTAVGMSDVTIDGVSAGFMEQMSAQIRLNFASEMRLYRSELESTRLAVRASGATGRAELRDGFAQEAAARGFAYVGVIYPEGRTSLLLGPELALDERDAFVDGVVDGSRPVTVGTSADGESMLVFGEVLENRRLPELNGAVLVAGVPLGEVVSALSLDVSATQVYTHIIRPDGSFILNSNKNLDADSYLGMLRDNEGRPGVDYDITADELAQVMDERGSVFYVAVVGGERYASYLAPLEGTDWFIVSVLPHRVLHDPIDSLAWSLVAAAFVGCLAILVALLAVFVRYLRLLRSQMDELDRARAASDAASLAKSRFLSNMSHDIRTPMNAIVGMTQIAREHVGDPVAVSGCLDKIANSSAHLLNLVNDVLDMSRIESGRMELASERVSLPETLDAVEAIARTQAEVRGVTFVVERELSCPVVLTDGTRLSQVLLNLLSNAVKFTPRGGEVTLRVEQGTEPAPDGRVRTHVWVRDTGIGMSEEFMRRIFDSFEREDTERVRKTEGTGLGMSIVKRIVDGMGGSIQVSSEKGHGSTFHVTLDLERCAGEAERLAEPDPASLAGARVLLAEDNELNWDVASELLGACGLELDWAENGRECVERFSASEPGHYDAILMDLRMPEMTGYEATRAIRALDRPDARSVPIVAMTADAFEEDRQRARGAGMDAHVAKPIDVAEVLRVLARLVGGRDDGRGGA